MPAVGTYNTFSTSNTCQEAVWCIDTTRAEVFAAFAIEHEADLAFWDALIVAAARKAGAVRILSEDFNPGQIIAGLQIENPFATDRTSHE